MKRIVVMAVCAVILLSAGIALGAEAAKQFADVEGHWAKTAIDFLQSRAIVKGRPDGTFGPNENITRAEAAQMIYGYQQWRGSYRLASINRGCPACHAQTPARDGRLGVAVSRLQGHPKLAETAGVDDCKVCHIPGGASKLMLRTIAHPIHLNSPIFIETLRGNCWSCHDINIDGQFKVLKKPLAVNARGVPIESPFEADGKEFRADLK